MKHSVGHTHVGEVKEERRARKRLTYFRGLDSGNTHLSESEGKRDGSVWQLNKRFWVTHALRRHLVTRVNYLTVLNIFLTV